MASQHVWDDELEAIRERRRLSRISDAELGRAVGVSRSSIIRYMNGGDPPYSVVKALAEVLGIDVVVSITRRQQSDDLVGSGVAA